VRGLVGDRKVEVGSIGERASRGCIRMLIADVEELDDRVPVGAPVYIG
jgi:lipoprotein-anchoring transpeptidase ErfK/SrfK